MLTNVATITKGMHNTKKTITTIVVETITTIMEMNTIITMGMRDTKVSFYTPGCAGTFQSLAICDRLEWFRQARGSTCLTHC
ncbi:hypothetical protein NHP21005_01600 [Helicobacter sp. NHP21005]|uniref:hypothetical protein n=1 Tax=Helicobacter felistomachi TaxID=3040201 RepID=UPI0025745673|nr:hypothetical protein [Helicobacter sp. NHP21005]BEG56472.1 hypothetical protein NHP21005_01600 [Helicobacter sp. NHP21005]